MTRNSDIRDEMTTMRETMYRALSATNPFLTAHRHVNPNISSLDELHNVILDNVDILSQIVSTASTDMLGMLKSLSKEKLNRNLLFISRNVIAIVCSFHPPVH